jgi:hypothetical protein
MNKPPMPGNITEKVVLAVLAGGLAVALIALYFFNPSQHAFFPVCSFHKMTGLNCPGCGGLRAVHQLAHGHVREAFFLNPLVVLGAPMTAWYGGRAAWCLWKGRPVRSPGTLWIVLICAGMMAFGILRNLPVFSMFSP